MKKVHKVPPAPTYGRISQQYSSAVRAQVMHAFILSSHRLHTEKGNSGKSN